MPAPTPSSLPWPATSRRITLGVPEDPTEDDVRWLLSLMTPCVRLKNQVVMNTHDMRQWQELPYEQINGDWEEGVRFLYAT